MSPEKKVPVVSGAERRVERLSGDLRTIERGSSPTDEFVDSQRTKLKQSREKLRAIQEGSLDTESEEAKEVLAGMDILEEKVLTHRIVQELDLPIGKKGERDPDADRIRTFLRTKPDWLKGKIEAGDPNAQFYENALYVRELAAGLAHELREENKVLDHNDAVAQNILRLVNGYTGDRGPEALTGYALESFKNSEGQKVAELMEQLKETKTLESYGEREVMVVRTPLSQNLLTGLGIVLRSINVHASEGTQLSTPKDRSNSMRLLSDGAFSVVDSYRKTLGKKR